MATLLLAASPSDHHRLTSEVLRFLDNGGVVVTHGDEVLYHHRGDELFVPASTLKIATALTALHTLGTDYRFKTELYLNDSNDLTVRGYGDPFLVSEEWEILVGALVESGKLPTEIRNLYLDTSAFAADLEIPGIASTRNPYDALNGALAANFNTIYVVVERGGKVRSAEEQTPLTTLGRRLAAGLPTGKQRVNLTRKPEVVPRYAGELARAFLAKHGVEVTGTIEVRRRGADDRLIYTHRNSRTLEEVIAAMMEYSNNFIANQLFLTLGLEQDGEPATLEKGARQLERFLAGELGLDRTQLKVVEGSGISRQNRITPLALAEVVRAFHPYRHLLSKQDGVALKTGTLTGVYALAGYLASERPLCFAILLNQPRNTRDQVLGVLQRAVDRTF